MHCNNGLNNKLVETLVENKVTEETGDLRYLQDSMYDFVSTLKEIILGEYSPEFFNRYVDEALKLHGSNLDEFLKIPKMGLELRQALNSIDDAIDISNQEFRDNLVLLLDRFQTTLDNMEYEARDPYDTAVELGFQGTKQEWLDHLEGDSAYKIAALNGFGGTEEEWLDHLEGDSAYEIAVSNGYVGTQSEWLKYIRADGFIQSIQQFATNDAETQVQIPDYGTIDSLQGYIKGMFEIGGLPATPFKTKALMTASALVDGDYAIVTDDPANNGLYLKEEGAWVKSEYDVSALLAGEARKVYRTFKGELLNESINLFNPNDAVLDKFITSQGLIGTKVGDAISEVIYVAPNTKYTVSSSSSSLPAFNTINYYDNIGNFISRDVIDNSDDTAITTPAGCRYLRLNMHQSSPFEYNKMINIGDVALPYEPYKDHQLKEGMISDETIEYILSKQPPIEDNISDQYFKGGANLFNANDVISGYAVSIDGAETLTNDYAISHYIPVVAGDKYTLSGGDTTKDAFIHTSQYDSNKNFIQRVDTWNRVTRELTITIPQGVAYLRFNMAGGLPTEHNRMFNKGDTALPYEPYSITKLKEGLISDETVDYILSKQPPIKGNIADNYFKASANLFNANTATIGKVIRDTGVIESVSDAYSISDYIPVVAGDKYTISGGDVGVDAFMNTAYYDEDKEFIERANTWNRDTRELTITIPDGVSYARFVMANGLPTQHNRMFNKGEVALPYEPYYGAQLTGLTLADDVLQQISDEVVVSNKDNFIFDTPIDGTFNTDQVWTQYADWDKRKSAEIYTMYDALVAQHPDYITKQVLGNDSIGNEIAAYKFKPARAVATNPKRSPIIYLVCGTHGGENVPPLATYLMMEQICNNWRSDKLLEALRFNVDFIIIPVSNPSGRNSGMRKNANGVDIARSFPEGFGWQAQDPESPYYGGEEPLQELESQYISQIFDANPNIDICYDFHNFGGTGRDYYIWIPTSAGEKVEHMGQVLMQQMGRKWQAEFDWLPQRHDWFAGFVDETAGAMVQDHAKAKGVKFTATFEIARDWQLTTTLARYDQTHCKTMVEAITNWLLINLRNL